MTRVLAIGPDWRGPLLERLEACFPGWKVLPGAHRNWDAARSSDVLVPFAMKVTDQLLSGSRIRLVHQFGVGVDQIDLEAAKRHGVPVCNAPSEVSGMASSVAEGAVFLALCCARRPDLRRQRLESGTWNWAMPLNLGLSGRRAGLVGLGSIGTAIAARLHSFGMTLVGVRRDAGRTVDSDGQLDWIGGMDRLDELVSTSDFIVITVPLNNQSQGLFDAALLRRVKDGASIINVGRGGVIDEDALLAELDRERIHAVGLDTLASEPPTDLRLLEHPRVIITPHDAGATDIAFDSVARIIAGNLNAIETDGLLQHRVA